VPYRFQRHAKGLIVEYTGDVSVDTIYEERMARLAEPDYGKLRFVQVDFSDIRSFRSSEEVVRAYAFDTKNLVQTRTMALQCAAVVATDPVAVEMTQRYIDALESNPFPQRLFAARAPALAWIASIVPEPLS